MRKFLLLSVSSIVFSGNALYAGSLLWGEARDAIACSLAASALGDQERALYWLEQSYHKFDMVLGDIDTNAPEFISRELMIGIHIGRAEITVRYRVYPTREVVYGYMGDLGLKGDKAFRNMERQLTEEFAGRTYKNLSCGNTQHEE